MQLESGRGEMQTCGFLIPKPTHHFKSTIQFQKLQIYHGQETGKKIHSAILKKYHHYNGLQEKKSQLWQCLTQVIFGYIYQSQNHPYPKSPWSSHPLGGHSIKEQQQSKALEDTNGTLKLGIWRKFNNRIIYTGVGWM